MRGQADDELTCSTCCTRAPPLLLLLLLVYLVGLVIPAAVDAAVNLHAPPQLIVRQPHLYARRERDFFPPSVTLYSPFQGKQTKTTARAVVYRWRVCARSLRVFESPGSQSLVRRGNMTNTESPPRIRLRLQQQRGRAVQADNQIDPALKAPGGFNSLKGHP